MLQHSSMDWVVISVVAVSSLTSLPVAYLLNKASIKDHRVVFALGAACLMVAAAVPGYFLRRRYRNVHFIVYVFAMFCWSAVIDLFIGLELDGWVKGFMGFYFVEGEPYLNSSHGTLINYWDGTAHLLLQFSGIVAFTMQQSYREIGLYWCGSIINSLLVLILGACLGRTSVKMSILLNVPYAAFPLLAAFTLIKERRLQARSYRRQPPVWRRPVDLLFLLFFTAALLLAVFRGLVALGAEIPIAMDYRITYEPYIADPTAFPKVQMLVYLFYFGYYYLCAIDGLLNPGQLWMADWSILHAGAAAQAQVSYTLGAIHSRTGPSFRAPKVGVAGAEFWAVNLLLLVVPHLFAWRCWRDPDLCGHTATVDLARPISPGLYGKRDSSDRIRKRD